MKRFCLLTSGRAGSTSLMDALARFDDVGVPHKQIDCQDNEIFHPGPVARYMLQYQQLSGCPVHDQMSLLAAFYMSNRDWPYAGFKSMPHRHPDMTVFARAGNIQIITLRRQDTASTVASFLAAFDAGTWRREGGAQEYRLVFGPRYEQRTLGHVRHVETCERRMLALPGAIHLCYEDLCDSKFICPALDDFFQRRIQLLHPKPCTSAASYVDNWDEFCAFIASIRAPETEAGAK